MNIASDIEDHEFASSRAKVDIQELEKDLSSQLAAARCLVANLDMPTNRRQSVIDVFSEFGSCT